MTGFDIKNFIALIETRVLGGALQITRKFI